MSINTRRPPDAIIADICTPDYYSNSDIESNDIRPITNSLLGLIDNMNTLVIEKIRTEKLKQVELSYRTIQESNENKDMIEVVTKIIKV